MERYTDDHRLIFLILKNRSVFLTIAFILAGCCWLMLRFSWEGADGKGCTHIIESDGKGYYMYLPDLFIKKNISAQPVDNRFIFQAKNGSVNKYFAGTAVAMLPFFGIGYAKAVFSGEPADGYSPPFQKAVSMAALFYLGTGLFFLARLLMLYNIRPLTVCITLLLIVAGTNLLMYAVYHPSFSHIYSFAFVTVFLFAAKKAMKEKTRASLLLMAFSFGMIVIIRPTNGIVILLLPFAAGSAAALKDFFRWLFRPANIAAASLLFLAVVAIQLYLWYLQTGAFFIRSYPNEGFYFLHPEIVNVLFSFRKGFFTYTPLALLSLGGLYFQYKQGRYGFYSLLLFYLLLIYITASWWCWYYGPSFGQRAFIEFYAVNALLLALLIGHSRYKKAVLAAALLCTGLNLLQSYQYVKDILSSWDMSYEKYKYVFLETGSRYYSCLGGCDDIKPYGKTETLIADTKNDFEKPYPLWNGAPVKNTGDSHGNVCDFTGIPFLYAFNITADSSVAAHRLLYAEVQLDKSETEASGNKGPLLVVSITNAENKFDHYYTFPLNEIPGTVSGTWQTTAYSIEIPGVKAAGNRLDIYIWNWRQARFRVDNFRVKLYGID